MATLAVEASPDCLSPLGGFFGALRPKAPRVLERLLAAWDLCTDGQGTAVLEAPEPALEGDPSLAELFTVAPLSLFIRGSGDGPSWRVEEARLAGLWRVLSGSSDRGWEVERFELTACPNLVAVAAAEVAIPPRAVSDQAPCPGLSELWAALRQSLAKAGTESARRVLNLSAIDLSDEARCALDEVLGHGAVVGRLEGQVLREITSTRLQRVWRVSYLDANGRVQLDTLEIGILPDCFLATPEELERSLASLRLMAQPATGSAAAPRRKA